MVRSVAGNLPEQVKNNQSVNTAAGNGGQKMSQYSWFTVYDKKVDITITKQNKPIAGFAIKFVMQNYSQNSNNYFENMLGETANIRSNRIPYFQIFIILDNLP